MLNYDKDTEIANKILLICTRFKRFA